MFSVDGNLSYRSLITILLHFSVNHICVLRYEGLSHTDPIIECPASGGRDRLLEDVLSIVVNGRLVGNVEISSVGPPEHGSLSKTLNNKPMAYAWQVRFARWVNPF